MRLPIVYGLLALTVACGKKSDDKADSLVTDAGTAADEVSAALTQAYPGALALSVFPKDNVAGSLRLQDAEATPESLKAKSEEAAKILKGEADNCLPPVFLRPLKEATETCYEFDQEMLVGSRSESGGPTATEYGTANGKSKITGSTEACLVSFARTKIKEIENILDQGLGMQQGMICQAVKDEVDVSGADSDEGVELKETLTDALASGPDSAKKPVFTVTEASMKKDEDGVYRVAIDMSFKTPDNKTITQKYLLSHVPDDASNSTYHGVISMVRGESGGTAPKLQQQGDASTGKRFLSISYTRSEGTEGEARLQAELRTGRFNSTLESSALNDDGTVNFNAGAGADGTYTSFGQNANAAVSGMMLVGFDLNTDNDTGTFEYWQNPGGNYNEAARGMVFKLEKNATTGRLEGCGMSGAARNLSIRKSIKDGTQIKPDGSYHPFHYTTEAGNAAPGTITCPANGGGSCSRSVTEGGRTVTASWTIPTFTVAANITAGDVWARNQMSTYVTRQCVGQNADGVYEIDPVRITEAAGYELFSPAANADKVIAVPTRPKDAPPPPPAGK